MLSRKKYGKFMAICLTMMLAILPAGAAESLATKEVMAAVSTAKPTKSKITRVDTSVVSGVNTVSLTWSKAKNTTNYRIYYKEAGEKWKLMKSLGSAKTSVTLTSSSTHPINTGITYYFTVRTYNKNSGKYGRWDKTGTKVAFTDDVDDKVVKVTQVSWIGSDDTFEDTRGLRENNGILKLEAKVLPPTATDKTLSWTSSNTAVATVSSDGTVKMLKNGKTTITAKANGGDVSAAYELEVIDEELIAQNIFELTNQKRIENGREPLIYSKFLHNFSMTRAKELSIKYSHERPDGTRTGYGENIAKSSSVGGDGSEAVEAWMNSMGHRATLLGAYRSLGVGVYIENEYTYYVQDFCAEDSDQTYTLTLDCNGGTGPSSIEVSQNRKIYQKDLPVPQRQGYIFKGWAITDRLVIFNSMVVRENMTLTAVWEPAN